MPGVVDKSTLKSGGRSFGGVFEHCLWQEFDQGVVGLLGLGFVWRRQNDAWEFLERRFFVLFVLGGEGGWGLVS